MKISRQYYLGYDQAILDIINWFTTHNFLPPKKHIKRNMIIATLQELRKHQNEMMETAGDFDFTITPAMGGLNDKNTSA